MGGSIVSAIDSHDFDISVLKPTSPSPHFQTKPIPIGREGTPQEFSETVRFLCGPNSRYTTGQTLHVNGGWYVSIN